MKAAKTPWLNAMDFAPTRPGIYLIRTITLKILFWREFDGQYWHSGIPAESLSGFPITSPPRKENLTEYSRVKNNLFEWCGLAEEPK